MGNLLLLNNIHKDKDATWYFPDAYYSSESNGYKFKWPNDAYPYNCYIHYDDVVPTLKIQIRKFIEASVETVIYQRIDKSYLVYATENTGERLYTII